MFVKEQLNISTPATPTERRRGSGEMSTREISSPGPTGIKDNPMEEINNSVDISTWCRVQWVIQAVPGENVQYVGSNIDLNYS